MWTMNFQLFKLVLENAEEPEIKLPTFIGSSKKLENSRKTSTSALLIMPKPLTVWTETWKSLSVSDSLQLHGLYNLWNSPGQNTGVDSCSLLQGIFPTQGSNPCLPYCRQILYQLSHHCLDHKNCGKFFKRLEYLTTLHVSWGICMQIKKQQLEPDLEQQIGSKLGKEYVKAVYCLPVYLTYMQSTSCKMLGWMNLKLESRLPGEISITSDTQIPPLWQRAKN